MWRKTLSKNKDKNDFTDYYTLHYGMKWYNII